MEKSNKLTLTREYFMDVKNIDVDSLINNFTLEDHTDLFTDDVEHTRDVVAFLKKYLNRRIEIIDAMILSYYSAMEKNARLQGEHYYSYYLKNFDFMCPSVRATAFDRTDEMLYRLENTKIETKEDAKSIAFYYRVYHEGFKSVMNTVGYALGMSINYLSVCMGKDDVIKDLRIEINGDDFKESLDRRWKTSINL